MRVRQRSQDNKIESSSSRDVEEIFHVKNVDANETARLRSNMLQMMKSVYKTLNNLSTEKLPLKV